jgi:uncharacterized membrane protein (UPF0127 family)
VKVRRMVSLVMVAIMVWALAVPGARSQTTTTLSLRGSLTASRIEGFGRVEPPANSRSIQVRLSTQEADGSFTEVARKQIGLEPSSDSDGDGVAESRFIASFKSPDEGNCKIVARFPKTRVRSGARRSVTLPCNRPDFPTGTARLRDVSGTNDVTIDVEIADNDALRAFGLMYKRHLAADRGMAFLYSGPASGGYWMKNTLIPLSIAFFESGVIVRIMDMEPCTPRQDRTEGCPTYDPETSYSGALEVNQGAFDEWGIEEGDLITVSRD